MVNIDTICRILENFESEVAADVHVATSALAMAKLEAALTHMINQHSQANVQLRHRTENTKKVAVVAANHVSALLVDILNAGVQESFVNEKRIELETRALAATVQQYTKQTNQWLTAVRTLDTALKEIGDFENWMKIMEQDCERIFLALQHIQSKENDQI